MPIFFDNFNTFKIFFEFPDVEIAINVSPFWPKPSRFLAKIFSKPISLPHAVIVEASWAKAITGKDLRFTLGLNLIKNSVAKCCASAAEPPFPHIKIFLLLFIVEAISFIE